MTDESLNLFVVVNAVNGPGVYEHPVTTQDQLSPSDNIQPPRRTPDYHWKLAGSTDCSAPCGQGQSWGLAGDLDHDYEMVCRGFLFVFRNQTLSFYLRVPAEPRPGVTHVL